MFTRAPYWIRWLLSASFLTVLVLALTSFSFRDSIKHAQAQSCEQLVCSRDTQDEDTYLRCIKEKQSCWQTKINDAQNTASSLSNTISILNGKIALQELQIAQTQAEIQVLEREITDLNQRIAGLEVSLDRLTELLVKRVQEQYKRSRATIFELALLNNTLGTLLSKVEYMQRTQNHVSGAMERAESQRLDYDQQKALKEVKQAEISGKQLLLEQQQTQLASQRVGQQRLLAETKNNESRYQAELAKTQAELNAIQSIIAGRGDETPAGEISQGSSIANIIVGASPCSTGSHLHFEVVKDGAHRDPAGYLKGIDASWNNSPDSSFSFSGSWDWPVNNPARINQGYGQTYYASVRRAYGGAPHTGIDMFSKSSGDYSVKAVKDGTLYRGSIACGGGQLRYVKVEHKDDGISTYYLHVNY